jgi:hypothetical protein
MGKRLDQILPTDDIPLASERLHLAMLGENIGEMLAKDRNQLFQRIRI